jgi:cell division protein FtsI (penicillin-binding protein 3)
MKDHPPTNKTGRSALSHLNDVSEFWRAAVSGDRPPKPRSDAVEGGRARLAGLSAIFLVAFGAIAWRLFDLCLNPPAQTEHAAASGRIERADIVDRNGELLARDLSLYDISVDPTLLRDRKLAAADALAKALPKLDRATLRRRFSSDKSFVYILRDATPKDAEAVHDLGLPGIDFHRVPQRAYPQGSLFSHVLGYVNVDNKGIAGMELARDALLREHGEGGTPLQLSVDTQIQFAVRDVITGGMRQYGAEGGVGIVMNVANGELLSLVSLPDFDPNKPAIKSDARMKNRATSSLYEMGSTFKAFTFAIGFDTGTVKFSDSFDATHPLRVAGRRIEDYHPTNKWLSPLEVFLHSSNIGAAEMALRFGPDKQREYMQRFGLLSPSPIELPEVTPPLVQSQWGPVETATIAYGYGLSVSPVQLVSGLAALMNGGNYIPPTLIKRAPGEAPKATQVVSNATSQDILYLMRQNVLNGTGRSANIPGYAVGGKTGTAQKHGDVGYNMSERVSSFAAVFPVDAPKYLVLVMLDDPTQVPDSRLQPTGGATAAPLSGLIIRRIAPILGMPPEQQEVSAQEASANKL